MSTSPKSSPGKASLPGQGKTVLISGGSIAGPAVAWWLNRYGFKTTIVERWHELRPGGQNIDVRGVGRYIISQMGLFDKIKARNTSEEGFVFVNSAGKELANIPAFANGPTAELEILRGDFAQVLYDATKEGTNYLFGDYVVGIDDEENGKMDKEGKATVTFHSGRKEEYDIVIIADGVRSRTRKMVFGDEVTFSPLGDAIAWATIPRLPTDKPFGYVYNAPGRRVIGTRPDPYGTLRVCLSIMSGDRIADMDQQERLDFLRRKFAGAGWITDRILEGLENADDLYCDDLMKVHAPRYSAGRVVLLGDAGYCATPISGEGTTLSLAGAFILAAELARAPDDHKVAFEEYERTMRPIATKSQKLPPFTPDIAHPETWWGVMLFQAVVTVVGVVVNAAIGFPWPKFVLKWVERQGFGDDKTRVPEYRELRQYW